MPVVPREDPSPERSGSACRHPLGLHVSARLPALLDTHPDLIVELIFRESPSDLIGEAIDFEVRLRLVGDSSLICRRIGWTTAW